MRSIIEQVDEFVEGWFDGSILYQNIDRHRLPQGKVWISDNDTSSITIMDASREIINANITNYLKNEQDKEELAKKIFVAILQLRSLGVIQTNINVTKDIQFFKERCKQLESQNKEALQAYAQVKEKLEALSDKPKSDFKGFS